MTVCRNYLIDLIYGILVNYREICFMSHGWSTFAYIHKHNCHISGIFCNR
eukprot:UN03055